MGENYWDALWNLLQIWLSVCDATTIFLLCTDSRWLTLCLHPFWQSKFGIEEGDEAGIQRIVQSYLEGLYWVLTYYHKVLLLCSVQSLCRYCMYVSKTRLVYT